MTAINVAIALACSLAAPLVCTAAGAAIGRGSSRQPGADMLVGLGLAGGVLTILAVTTPVPLRILMLGVTGLAVAVPLVRRTLPGGVVTWLALLLAMPLLVRAAANQATLWDEFWQWLPSAAYAFTHDALPRPGLPPSTAQLPGYPQSIPLAIAAASFLARRFLESAGSVLNVALLAAYGALLADTVAVVRGRKRTATSPLATLAITAVTVAVVLVFNPGLDGEVLLSSYADPGTMIMVGALGLLGVELLARLAGRSAADPAEIAWRFGFVAAALINLKQANAVLLALTVAGLGIIVLCDPNIRLRRAAALLPQLLAPAIVIYLVWRWYVAGNFPSGEVHFRPFATWNFSDMPSTFASILEIMRTDPLFHGGMWLVTAVGLAVLPGLRHRGDEARWLAVMTAVVWLGYNAFLLLVYLAAFSVDEARRAGDYWRYTPHVALLALAVPVVALARVRLPHRVPRGGVALICAAAALLAPILRTDLRITPAKRWPLFVRSVAAEISGLVPPGSGIVLALGYNGDPYPIIVRYQLWQLGDPARAIFPTIIWFGQDLGQVDALLARNEVQYLILQDRHGDNTIAVVAARLGVAPPHDAITLFERRDGQWQTIKSWPMPSDLAPK